MRSSINVDRPIEICHGAATCQLLKASKLYRPISDWHVAIGYMWTNQVKPHVIFPRGMLSRHHKWYESISVWHVAYGGKIYATWQIDTSRNFHSKSMWAVQSKSDSRGPPDRNPILPRGCHVSDGTLQNPIRAWHVAYSVTSGIWHVAQY